ncbi:MAG: rhomboid family intramembrane serine protease [Myxococcota bacterium]
MQIPGFPAVQSTAAKLAIGLIAGSVLFALTRGSFGALLVLTPELALRHFMLWQPLTYTFIETSPLGVIFGALIIWSIGGALEMSWGARRMLFFAVGVTVLAGVLTALVGLFSPVIAGLPFGGGTVMVTALWVGYGLSFGTRQTNFWGLPVTGHVFALIGVGFVFLNGAFGSWLVVIPDALGILLTAYYVKMGSPRVLWLRFTSWRLQRQLKARSSHLKVIGGDRNMRSDSDRYLH